MRHAPFAYFSLRTAFAQGTSQVQKNIDVVLVMQNVLLLREIVWQEDFNIWCAKRWYFVSQVSRFIKISVKLQACRVNKVPHAR